MTKRLFSASAFLSFLLVFSLNQPRALAEAGTGLFNFSPANWSVSGMGLAPSGAIMVAGSGVTIWGEFVAGSVTSSGTLNTAFGGGVVTTAVSSGSNWANAAAVQSDGKLVSGGFYSYSKGTGFALVRYNTNGSLDSTFNKTGIVKTQFKSNNEQINAMALQSDGKIVVSGQAGVQSQALVTQRYTSAGTLDTTFGSGGTITDSITSINGQSVQALAVTAVRLQSTGAIIVGAIGYFNSPAPYMQMVLIRYTSAGRDRTFGNGGLVSFAVPGCRESYLADMDIDSDDSIVAAGQSTDSSNDFYLTLARFTSSGALDTTMGGGAGYVRPLLGDGSVTSAYSVALQTLPGESNKYIVISGLAPNSNLLVARFDSYGNSDNTFGSVEVGGVPQGYSEDFAVAPARHRAVVIQPDNKIVVAGVSSVARYTVTGVPDTSF